MFQGGRAGSCPCWKFDPTCLEESNMTILQAAATPNQNSSGLAKECHDITARVSILKFQFTFDKISDQAWAYAIHD